MKFMSLFAVIGFSLLLVFLLTFAVAGFSAAPWVPTWGRDVRRFLTLAELRPGQIVYDLGCGDGRIVAAARRAGCRAIGFEVSLLPYLIGKLRERPVEYKNFWDADLRDADVVYFFLMPKVLPRLAAKLEQELKKGAVVVSYVWPIPDWTPETVDHVPGQLDLYRYRIPAVAS